MRTIPSFLMILSPRMMCEFAMKRSQMTAVAVNAVNGAFFMTAVSMRMLGLFTGLLVALLGILFGPLVSFTVSSIYSRIEWTVGRRLGGNAALDDLYRIFAWSFLPFGLACLIYGFILFVFIKPQSPTIYGFIMDVLIRFQSSTTFAELIPPLVVALWCIWSYCSNIIAVQHFSRIKGAISLVLTFFLFLVIIAGGVGFFSLLIKYGKNVFFLKEIFFWL
jgi:hypothetical protein